MFLKTIAVGPLDVNCYILADENSKNGILIDPGGDFEKIDAIINAFNISLSYIVVTHGHWDHIGAVLSAKETYKCPVCLHKDDLEIYSHAPDLASIFGYEMEQPPQIDMFIAGGDTLFVNKTPAKIIHTPGHSMGSVSILADNMIFTGDLIFQCGVGRTDFPGGSDKLLKESIKNKIFTLNDDTIIYPGHGDFTTVIREKLDNPFF